MTTQQQLKKALSLDVDHFKQTMKVTDDPMETTVTLSTVDGFVEKHGLLGIVWNDCFLRGNIDKGTGGKTYQCYVVLKHLNGNWANPYQANYGKPLRTTEVSGIYTNADCSTMNLYGSCKYEEHVVFEIHPDEIKRIYTTATPDQFQTHAWLFRIKNQSMQDYDDGILLPEMLALIEMMNSYQFVPMQ